MSNEEAAWVSGPDGGAVRAVLPLNDYQRGVETCIEKLNGRVKHCGRSAFRHLRGAWALFGVDDEMAAFRAITAEEEAAAALLLSLRSKRYPGAEALNFRDHVQKAALTPFLKGVQKVMALTDFAGPTLHLHPEHDPPRLDVTVNLREVGLDGEGPLRAQPDNPLNFVVHLLGSDGARGVHMFEEQLKEVAQGRGLNEIKDLMRAEANLRNQLLYATDIGIPKVQLPESFLVERLRRVVVLLSLVIAIQQTANHQLFAVQCLKAYLRAMQKMEGDPFNFDQERQTDVGIFIEKDANDAPKARFVHYTFAGYVQRGSVTVDRVRFLPFSPTAQTTIP